MAETNKVKMTGDQLRRRTVGGPLAPHGLTKRRRDEFYGTSSSGRDLGSKSTDPLPPDSRKDPINNDRPLIDTLEERYEMKEGDIFLKHSSYEDSTFVAIKEEEISLSLDGGYEGIKIKAGEGVSIQSELNIKNLGAQITKAWFTENPLSFIPSTTTTPIPGYLFKIPEDINLFAGDFMDLFKDFISKFYKG